MHARVIGIDLGVTAAHQAVVLDSASGEFLGRPRALQAWPEELSRLLQRACQGGIATHQVAVVLEATGMAWYPISLYLQREGATVYRVNGRKTRDLRRALQRHAGSDRIDCRVLAQLYQVAHTQLIPWSPPGGATMTLQRLCREYAHWRELDVASQNRLHALDQWAWGGLERLIPAEAQEWMYRHWYDPWAVVAAGETRLAAAWQQAAIQEEADTTWIPAWTHRAERLIQLYATPATVDYPTLAASIQRELDTLAANRQTRQTLFRTQIAPLYHQLFPERWLETIQGIGAPSAALYMAFIQDIARFPTVAQFRAWCGIVPWSHQSGTQEAKHQALTQAGPNLIKATLSLNAEVARQWDVQLAALYYRQMVQYGKHHTQAVCACASHLASRIYAVLKAQRPYELRDEDQHPLTSAQSRELCRTRYLVPEEVRQRNAVHARKARAEQRVESRFTG